MADCGTCRETRTTADSQYTVDIVSAMAERTIKRLWITIILLIVLLVGSNCAWIYYESQFVEETWTYEATTDGGGNAIANGDGEVNVYGESKSNTNDANP